MERRNGRVGWLALVGTLVLNSWGVPAVSAGTKKSQSGSAGTAKLLSLRLVPENPTLWGAKASQRFLVLGKYADGLERDLTSTSRFSISKPRIAKVESIGRVIGMADGKAVLTASVGGRSASTGIRVESSQEKRPFSFPRAIVGIFTRNGCNDSGCHGGVKGRGGFKLSLGGLDPREDYEWIVEGGTYQVLSPDPGTRVPRVDLKESEKSLLLQKPTFTVPHGGGERFKVGSRDYEVILTWIRNGAPYSAEDSKTVTIERLEAFPKEVVLDPKGRHQLLVSARLSNGQREDLTDQVRYTSSNPEVVKVTSGGLVEAARTGETPVLIRAVGRTISVRVGVISKLLSNYPEVPRNNFVDKYVFAKLQKFSIVPSELASDEEFLRRVCLDLTGTLPPPARVREFLTSKDPGKRDKLIEALLNTPEYVDYWTFRFADLFRVARYAQGVNGRFAETYWEWIRDSITENKPYDQMARERLAAQGYNGPSRHYFGFTAKDPETRMAEEVRVFMGRRLDCAQCHNHPFEAWSQNQFWGLAAFFGRMNIVKFGPQDDAYGSVLYDDPKGVEVAYGEKGKSRKTLHPRTKMEVQPTFFDREVLPATKREDLRLELAKWMTSHPYFAEATVNRMWNHFFSRGIVEPVDDFLSTNPPTHPDLLRALAQDFREHGYDLKDLMRKIVSSRTYQLSSQPNETNRDDQINYSHSIPRALDAEVLLDAISHITGAPEIFEHRTDNDYPGTAPPGTRAINLRESDIYPHRFSDMYGRSLRYSVPERKVTPNLVQALHILVGSTYTDKISGPGGRVDQLLKAGRSDAELIEELYLLALSRFPAEKEKAKLLRVISQGSSRKETIQDLTWALVSSREFAENH